MLRTTTLGYPRIGRNRELKQACEAYWSSKIGEEDLYRVGATLRRTHWQVQRDAGIDLIAINDFSFYDQVLDAIALIGAVPPRYHWEGGLVDLSTYFAMARGVQRAGLDATAMEMTKWFDTNYHYIVPEWHTGQRFQVASTRLFDEFAEAQAQNVPARPVLIGPFSLVLLGKACTDGLDVLGETLTEVSAVYGDIIARLAALGASWIQLDEPCLTQDRTPAELAVFRRTYQLLTARKGNARLLLSTSFGSVGESYETLITLPVDGIGLDFVRGSENRGILHRYGLPSDKVLVAGVVDGRNIWRTNLSSALNLLDDVTTIVPPERLIVAPSCSLMHVPYDVNRESEIAPEVRQWLAFAEQKLGEVVTLGRAVHEGRGAVAKALEENIMMTQNRATSLLVHDASVQQKLASQQGAQRSPYSERRQVQSERLGLPCLPTTTIGSFPQTTKVRRIRKRFEMGQITPQEYEHFMKGAIAEAIARQEQLGIDVLVHGEFERNDMVQYFGEQLSGFAFTHHGWVQSYGSRSVRPPIIYGDVARPAPMTVRWSIYAQSLTNKPVKGMLTGPVTMLNWSFVRDDQPRDTTCRQIALALSEEVTDLERAGLRAIQIDEPALREGLPLRRSQWNTYLNWAVACFRLTTSGAGPATQIHTHMCYSAFNDIIDAITALDADVISLENSRSAGEVLEVFRRNSYEKEIGPGVYDIHSPRIPSVEEIEAMLQATLQVLPATHIWVNPDCGLKTRSWEEVIPALEHMVAATRRVRSSLVAQTGAL